jgi:OFA family oxalate/formate antiporter-like MFS transporter
MITNNRWIHLALGIVCMAMIANLQYGWTLFVDPIDAKFHWGRAAIQGAFSLFVITETWLVPVEAWFVDRYGPRIVIMFGGVMIAAAWSLNAVASSIPLLYLAAILGGIGAGSVYGTCVGNALKWFPDRRGLAAGATAAGFGAGAALTVVPIGQMIAASGYQTAFLTFGLGQGAIVLLLAQFIRSPKQAGVTLRRPGRFLQSKINYTPQQTLRSPVFWALYAAFVMVACCGLSFASNVASMARDLHIATVQVSVLGLQGAALAIGLSLQRIFDGFGRPFFGWVADLIGRENTMAIAFSIAAGALFMVGDFGQNPYVFVAMSAVYFLAFGEIYSLFPSTCGDTFGSKFAATNAGLLYTAKGTAALLVPLASLLAETQGWNQVFHIGVGLNLAAAAGALLIIKPLRARHIRNSQGTLPAASAPQLGDAMPSPVT